MMNNKSSSFNIPFISFMPFMPFKPILMVIFIALSLASTSSMARFNCDKIVKELEWCQASFQFIEGYTILCKEGNELTPADISSLHKMFEAEMATNPCISKIYKEPRTNQKARDQKRKEIKKYKREIEKERREEKRLEREAREKEKELKESK